MAFAAALLLGLSLPGATAARDGAARPASATDGLQGLVPSTGGRCAGGYRIAGTDLCTHGPDTRPGGRRALGVRLDAVEGVPAGAPGSIICDGDGVSGDRIQAVYARTATGVALDGPLLATLRGYAVRVQDTFLASAARTEGVRRPRWVTDGQCRLKVDEVVLSDAAAGSLSSTITELEARGYDRADRKYLIWFDATTYCGIGTFYPDDSAALGNASNRTAGYARVDRGCWDWAEAHEVMHTLGAVQDSAPHSTYRQGAFGHCSDEYDLMCYRDGPEVTMSYPCPDSGLDALFDCGNDDYFHTDPGPSSYLASHWNTADSGWLSRTVATVVAPTPHLVAGVTMRGDGLPAEVTFARTAPLPGYESITLQRLTRTGTWARVDVVPTSALSTRLRLPSGTPAQLRARTTDADGVDSAWRTGPALDPATRQETSRTLAWNGRWKTVADASAMGGKVRRSSTGSASVAFTAGPGDVGVLATVGPNHGQLEVWIDGTKVATIDTFAPEIAHRQVVYARTLTGSATHRVRLRVTGSHSEASAGDRVDIDAILLLTR